MMQRWKLAERFEKIARIVIFIHGQPLQMMKMNGNFGQCLRKRLSRNRYEPACERS